MTLTLGVKNMFGVVPGQRKSQWHLSAGVDRMHFARMLVDLYRKVSPQLTLMDGIIGMDGNGPGNGDPKELGLIAAAEDAVALDAVISEIVGLKRERMPTTLAAEEMGAGQTRLEHISIAGEDMGNFQIDDFVFPATGELMGMFPGFLREPLRNWLTTRPVLDSGACKMCLICLKNCPAKVITEHGASLRFDLERCIRCFCCQEMCPEGAITVGRGPLARLLRL
jgi:Pyruvate/2-oxoacid:ferredoxin oxidoreductase delta subunit